MENYYKIKIYKLLLISLYILFFLSVVFKDTILLAFNNVEIATVENITNMDGTFIYYHFSIHGITYHSNENIGNNDIEVGFQYHVNYAPLFPQINRLNTCNPLNNKIKHCNKGFTINRFNVSFSYFIKLFLGGIICFILSKLTLGLTINDFKKSKWIK